MREIKFRAWSKINKVMLDNVGVQNSKVLFGFHDEYELMQFTGLHDKNGVEIYDGDVVMDPSEYGGKKTVQWNIGMCRFEFDKMLGYPLYSGSSEKCEVIGNIYEGNHETEKA